MKSGCKILLLLAFALFLITPLASAATFLNIYIDETGKVTFSGETDKQLDLPAGIELNNGIISGETQELTSKQGSVWTFSYELSNSDFYIVLPENSVIKKTSNGEIYIEDTQLSIYASDEIEINYVIEEEECKTCSLTPVLIILLIVVVIYYWRLTKKKPKKTKEEKPKEDKLEIIKQVLNDREKQIIDKLKETGKIKGSYLRRACNIPKPSFYRHILELEKKGLVKRSGDGRNKFIELIKKS